MIRNFTTNVWNSWRWNFIPSVFSVFLTINDAQPFTVLWHIFRHDLGCLSIPKGRFQDHSCSQRIGMDWWLFQLIQPKLDGINWFQSDSMFPNKHTNKLEIIENHQKNPSLQVAVAIRWTQHARWFLFQAFTLRHVKILLWRVGRRQSLWQWCRPRPVIPKIRLATPHIHLKRTSKGLVMRNARSNAQVVVRHIWTAAFCLQWTSNALRCSITMETLGSLVKSSTHWICTPKSNLHN